MRKIALLAGLAFLMISSSAIVCATCCEKTWWIKQSECLSCEFCVYVATTCNGDPCIRLDAEDRAEFFAGSSHGIYYDGDERYSYATGLDDAHLESAMAGCAGSCLYWR